jgi:hypothetical protein
LSVVASMLVTDDRRRGAEQFARMRGWHGVTADAVLDMPAVLIGTIEQISDDVCARRDRLGLSYRLQRSRPGLSRSARRAPQRDLTTDIFWAWRQSRGIRRCVAITLCNHGSGRQLQCAPQPNHFNACEAPARIAAYRVEVVALADHQA